MPHRIIVMLSLIVILSTTKNWNMLSAALSEVEQAQESSPREQKMRPQLDVPYESTPYEVVDEMLKIAKVHKTDIVYDLGCGDGRIVIAAAKQYGAKGVGVDIDPKRIQEARLNATKSGVADKVTFLEQDLFKTELSDATVIALFLHYDVNLRLRPKLMKELRPGARVVSSTFDMGDWEPDLTSLISGRTIYCWVIPQRTK